MQSFTEMIAEEEMRKDKIYEITFKKIENELSKFVSSAKKSRNREVVYQLPGVSNTGSLDRVAFSRIFTDVCNKLKISAKNVDYLDREKMKFVIHI